MATIGRTGETCQISGEYKPLIGCSKKGCPTITMKKGRTFPPCSGCHEAITWILL